MKIQKDFALLIININWNICLIPDIKSDIFWKMKAVKAIFSTLKHFFHEVPTNQDSCNASLHNITQNKKTNLPKICAEKFSNRV